jgi:uncharacterized membrane protein
MRSFTKSIHIDAPTETVWNVITDVEHWPDWTRSITTLKRLDAGPLAVGSRARIKQPKLLPALWTVTRMDPGRSFTWMSRMPGLRAIGYHAVRPSDNGSDVTLVVLFEGIFGGIAGLLLRKLNEEYLEMEAAGLKGRCEAMCKSRT